MGSFLSKYWWNDGLDDDIKSYGFSRNGGTFSVITVPRHFHFLEQDATTRIAMRVQPEKEGAGCVRKKLCVLDYCCDANRRTQNLFIIGNFDGFLRAIGDTTSQTREGFEMESVIVFDIFLMAFTQFITNSDGRVWLNGFTMNMIGEPSTRLKCIDLNTDPLRLTFKNQSAEEIEVIRSVERLELIGKPSGLGDLPKTLRIYGPDVSKIEAKATPNDGTVLLTFPTYKHNRDMEFVWPDYYYSV